jgi:hypothetical protein
VAADVVTKLLTVLLGREIEDDNELVQITTFALMVVEAFQELTNIRRLLTPPKDS